MTDHCLEDELNSFLLEHRPDLVPFRSKSFDTVLSQKRVHLALELFFPAQMNRVHAHSLSLAKSIFTPTISLMCFCTPRGDFYIVFQLKSTTSDREVYLMDVGTLDSESSACIIVTDGPECIISITSISPNRCENCNVACQRISKCSRCRTALGLRVLYCSKQCQIAHYGLHKALCGKPISEVSDLVEGPHYVLFSDPPK